MTKRLILIRHAKSSWDDSGMEDHARPLNGRGRDSATAIGKWLAAENYLPDEVLCSDAARTRETLALILPELPAAPQVRFIPALYHASASTMLAQLARASGDNVAIIGHNPGIGSFATGIVAARPANPRFADYPTAATSIIDFDITDWQNITKLRGTVTAFVLPRDLIGGAAD